MSRAAVLLAPLLSLALVSCGGGGNAENDQIAVFQTVAPSDGVDIRGRITELTTPVAGISPGGLAVEGEIEADTRYSKAWVRMKDSTIISRRRGADTVPAVMADLQPGARVEVKFAGVVAQLDPVQATAAEITIID